jgi:multidrug efflux pump subunit AcrA (membrane-fusion protein)
MLQACSSTQNKKSFTRAMHMKCVLDGKSLGKCGAGKPPTVTKTSFSKLTCAATTVGSIKPCRSRDIAAAAAKALALVAKVAAAKAKAKALAVVAKIADAKAKVAKAKAARAEAKAAKAGKGKGKKKAAKAEKKAAKAEKKAVKADAKAAKAKVKVKKVMTAMQKMGWKLFNDAAKKAKKEKEDAQKKWGANMHQSVMPRT